VTVTTVSADDSHSKKTNNDYAPPDTTNWIHGRVIRSTVQSTTTP